MPPQKTQAFFICARKPISDSRYPSPRLFLITCYRYCPLHYLLVPLAIFAIHYTKSNHLYNSASMQNKVRITQQISFSNFRFRKSCLGEKEHSRNIRGKVKYHEQSNLEFTWRNLKRIITVGIVTEVNHEAGQDSNNYCASYIRRPCFHFHFAHHCALISSSNIKKKTTTKINKQQQQGTYKCSQRDANYESMQDLLTNQI